MVIRLISLKKSRVKPVCGSAASCSAGAQARVLQLRQHRPRDPTVTIMAALLLATTPAAAQCTSQPALGGGTITSCSASDGERTQFHAWIGVSEDEGPLSFLWEQARPSVTSQ